MEPTHWILMLTIILGNPRAPDYSHTYPMVNAEECWKKANEFTAGKPPQNAIGLAAGCGQVKGQAPGEKSS